ncbi:MAG: hypothetical protein JJ863_18590 [Deltaproteobacteria bacterium]|nr:hypothetical protein [Deltaproteobacteria bacterium]
MSESSTARDRRAQRLELAKARLHERFAEVTRPRADSGERLLSGWPALDVRLGGLGRGQSLLVQAAPGAGGLALVGDWLTYAADADHRVALIDAEGSVAPEAALADAPIWVVRTPHGWVAADLLLRSGGFDLVAMVGVPPADRGRVGPRIRRLLAEHGTRLIALGARPPFRPDHSVSVSLAAVEWSASPVGDAPRRRTFRVETAGASFEVTRADCSIDRLRADPLAPDRRASRGRRRKR